jgi:hypothetical protein
MFVPQRDPRGPRASSPPRPLPTRVIPAASRALAPARSYDDERPRVQVDSELAWHELAIESEYNLGPREVKSPEWPRAEPNGSRWATLPSLTQRGRGDPLMIDLRQDGSRV